MASGFKEFFKKIKFSVVVVPSGSKAMIRSKSLSFKKVMLIFVLWTIVILGGYTMLLMYTPLKQVIFSQELKLNESANKTILELNRRVNYLLNELENLRANNQKLKDAILMGDSALMNLFNINPEDTVDIFQPNSFDSTDVGFDNSGSVWNIYYKSELESLQQKHIYFKKPIDGFISRGFDKSIGHFGVDYSVKNNSPVMAAANGYVVFADFTMNDGHTIILVHNDNYITFYKHCNSILKNVRDIVSQGEVIALSGNTGKLSTGPHLHFEIWKDGKAVDPKNVLLNY